MPAQFVSELAAGQSAQGHEIHVFVPASTAFSAYRQVACDFAAFAGDLAQGFLPALYEGASMREQEVFEPPFKQG